MRLQARPEPVVTQGSSQRSLTPALRAALYIVAALTLGAAAAPSHANGKVLGVVTGLALAGLVGYAIFVQAWTQWKDRRSGLRSALLILIGIAIIKSAALPWIPGLLDDVNMYRIWAAQITDWGPAHAYEGYFLDYPPGYLYPLWLMGAIAHSSGASNDALRAMIRFLPVVADFFLAMAVFVFVRSSRHSKTAATFAMLLVALNPALLYDSFIWGQSDSVLALLVVLSMASALRSEYEIAWGLAALAVLVKPQGIVYLPILAVWTMLRAEVRLWWRAALGAAVVGLVCIAPFQIGEPWNWIFRLYASTAAQYAETSVNAFNFMMLIGGLRTPDSVGAISFYTIGMSLLAPLYIFAFWILWRSPPRRSLLYAAFLAIFGFFMFAPRMHERYLYAALPIAALLAVDEPAMLIVLGMVTLGYLFNLAYVKHTLESQAQLLAPNDAFAATVAIGNLAALIYSAWSAIASQTDARVSATIPAGDASWAAKSAREPAVDRPRSSGKSSLLIATPPRWMRTDTMIVAALAGSAIVTRFWRLGYPANAGAAEFQLVAQARALLKGARFFDSDPPLATQLIALSIAVFGDHPWSWRIISAGVGSLLTVVTYLLGRRMLGSRLAAALGAAFVLIDGAFLVVSRLALPDIIYLSLAALSYLLVFGFAQTAGPIGERRWLVAIGVAIGLLAAARIFAPVVTVMLVLGSIVYLMDRGAGTRSNNAIASVRVAGALVLVGSLASLVYLTVLLPNYLLKPWGGLSAFWQYYLEAGWFADLKFRSPDPHPSPIWSWPLMLRPMAYWYDRLDSGEVATIWTGGNPVLWWSGGVAVAVTLVRLLRRPDFVKAFIVIGYLGCLLIWVPIASSLPLVHYLPALYLSYLALAALLAEAWSGQAATWEELLLMIALAPAPVLGLGVAAGTAVIMTLAVAYAALAWHGGQAGRLLGASFLASALLAFVYFLPLWTGLRISPAAYEARMWLHGTGVANWM